MPSHGVAVFDTHYIEYQKRYQSEVRESDKWLGARVFMSIAGKTNPLILDMGCSTGNFLGYLRRQNPNGFYFGIDIVEDYIESCKKNRDLGGIIFDTRDIVEISLYPDAYDVVVANMSMMFMNNSEYRRAIGHMTMGLKSGGHLFIMDYIHDYPHELEVTEKTEQSPFSVTFRMRPKTMIAEMCEQAKLETPTFEEFYMPYDLEATDLKTHTRKLSDGRNLSFRGILNQPWCLMKARKA